jgi:hypothetical protein
MSHSNHQRAEFEQIVRRSGSFVVERKLAIPLIDRVVSAIALVSTTISS